MIKLGFAFLAKAGDIGTDGLFSVLGAGIDQYSVPQIPFIAPVICLVVRLWVSEEDWGKEHTLRLDVVGPGGIKLPITLNFPFRLSKPAVAPVTPGVDKFHVMLNFVGSEFPVEGLYEFQISVGESLLDTVLLGVFIGEQK